MYLRAVHPQKFKGGARYAWKQGHPGPTQSASAKYCGNFHIKNNLCNKILTFIVFSIGVIVF